MSAKEEAELLMSGKLTAKALQRLRQLYDDLEYDEDCRLDEVCQCTLGRVERTIWPNRPW